MKKIKVFYMGERLRDVYPHATKWQVFKFKVRKIVRRILQVVTVGGMTAGVLYFTFLAGQFSAPSYVKADTQDNLPAKIESLKKEVVAQIKSCESNGHKEEDGLIVLDTNNKMSIGQLQFQTATVVYYYQTLYGKTITKKEAVEISLDSDRAEALAQDIIFKTDKGLTNWLNCANKLGLSAKVNVIKQIER